MTELLERKRRTQRQPVSCYRCGHTWTPYGRHKPKRCANRRCGSQYWDRPREKDKGHE